jgi:hypothetical protein
MINATNFHLATAALFTMVDATNDPFSGVDRKVVADFASRGGSYYVYTAEGVYRHSNHWGAGIASCDWYLGGYDAAFDTNSSDLQVGAYTTGFCAWADFQPTSAFNKVNAANTRVRMAEASLESAIASVSVYATRLAAATSISKIKKAQADLDGTIAYVSRKSAALYDAKIEAYNLANQASY